MHKDSLPVNLHLLKKPLIGLPQEASTLASGVMFLSQNGVFIIATKATKVKLSCGGGTEIQQINAAFLGNKITPGPRSQTMCNFYEDVFSSFACSFEF